MKKMVGLLALVSALALSGCSAMHVSSNTMPLSGNVKTDVNANVDVGQKISGTSSATRILFFTVGGDSKHADGMVYGTSNGGGGSSLLPFGALGGGAVGKVKSAAAYNAMHKSGADVIVAPQYTVSEKNYGVFAKYKVTVTGYKGTIQNIQ